ncbi:MAG: hypothetical protein GC204_08340 [Chloroflexi bacterium]|nr:hypothetical protein [Chloroflexota bacterium]
MGQRDRSKHWLFLSVIGLLLLTLHSVSAQDLPVLHVGVLDNERGSISNGARLAVREINAAGGVRGADGTMFQLDLVIEPSNEGSTLDQAISDLKTANVEAVLGPETTDEVVNNLTELQSLGVPVITPATGDTLITSDTSGLLFQSRAADALQGQALASYLISDYKLSPVATVQLDVASTASVVGFSTAASTLGVTPDPALILRDPSELADTVATLINADPAVVVAFGSPESASALYNGLRTGAWKGLFAYNDAFDPAFSDTVPFDQLNGIVAVTTWPFTADDLSSTTYLNSYIHAYGDLPDAVTAASYDSIKVIAMALGEPGNLRDNLANAATMPGVQGTLRAQDIGTNELSNNVSIVRLGDLGAPMVLARYQGNQRLPAVGIVTPVGNATATLIPTLIPPTATPQGVVLTIKQPKQNVRTGPGDNYEILGQLNQGEQAAVIGANLDYTYVVINFRGTQGWLAAYLVDISGDLRSVPVIPTPPTPVPVVTATPDVPQTTDLIIVSASIAPSPVLPNQTFTVTITVGNIGNVAAGPFVVAGTFAPNNLYLVGSLPGLGAGQSATVQLSGVLTGSGTYTVGLQMDANNQVNEGTVGEQNNLYNLTYTVGVSVLNQGSQTLNLGQTLDLEGNAAQGDVNWNSDGGTTGLKAIFGAHLAIIGGADFNTITYDQLNPGSITRDSIPRSELSNGTVIGIITADGHRGVMQVSNVTDTQISLNYRVYNG